MDKIENKLNPLARYAQQLALPGMTDKRQEKLASCRIFIAGASPTSIVCALNLAKAGISHLDILDNHLVQFEDLCTHTLFTENDIGLPKVDALKRKLNELVPEFTINSFFQEFNPTNAEQHIQENDITIEALDNWQEKLLASDICMQVQRPLIHSGLMGFSFHVFTMLPKRSACLRCLFRLLGLEDFPPKALMPGTLQAVASMAGAFQAAEAIKYITKLGTVSGNHLLRFDVLRSEFDDITELTKRSDCPDCGRF